ncbi:MAG TPA: ATP-binding cassette domain-containing protein [Spirochaetia bacterium]|nr:ATP-binding cassette domain-containing protein [Spirochaetia bacterium]
MILVNFEKQLPQFVLRAAFMVEGRETAILWGPSGAGKTTVLSCIAGLVDPDRGEIMVEGRTVFAADKGIRLPPQQRGVGLVFQALALFPHMSAVQNVAFAMPRGERDGARELLERFRLSHLAHRRPAQLSGGERQRLALARALGAKPRALLLDEPFSALDRRTREETYREFLEIRKSIDMGVILVTHDRPEAELLGTRMYELRDGEVTE